MVTSKGLTTLTEVAALLRSCMTGDIEDDAQIQSAIAVCERVMSERAELLKAVERLGRRLAICTTELARAARDLK